MNNSPGGLQSEKKAGINRSAWLKNVVHFIASSCLIIWITGIIAYNVDLQFHYFLVAAVAMALVRFLMEKRPIMKVRKGN